MIPTDKKIAVLHPRVTTMGGAVSMMLYLASVLQKYGNEVVFFTTAYSAEFDSTVDVPIIVSNKIELLFRLRDFDCIFIGNSPMHFVAAGAKMLRLTRAQTFWWHHHYPWYYNKHTTFYVFLKKTLERFFIRYIDEMLANSEFLKNTIQKLYSRDAKILFPVVDTVFLMSNKNKKNTNPPTLFTYSRWVAGKNIQQVFQTFEELKPLIPNLELYIAGVGPELDVYKDTSYKDVHFLGLLSKKELASYMQKATVFLFPSKVDSFGMVAAEAVCSGVPVVGFRGDAMSSVIEADRNGCTVESSDDFTKKTLLLLTDAHFYAQLRSFMEHAPCKYTPHVFIKNLEKIFS